jgi:hypothetical protein
MARARRTPRRGVDRARPRRDPLWLRMLATNRLVETRTRRLLQERYATTLPRFDLMASSSGRREGSRWASCRSA